MTGAAPLVGDEAVRGRGALGGPGGTLGLATVLFALNWVVAGRLFQVEYLAFMGSIEGTHIALGRWVLEHWPDLGWYPLWYDGLPFVYTYPPLLPHLVAASAHLAGWSAAHAYHAVTAAAYCLGPVTLFLMAHRLSAERAAAFTAAVLYSLLSPAALLIPAYRSDAAGALDARRLLNLVAYGDGPYVAALTLVPVAVLLFHLALGEKRYFLLPAAGAAAAAVAVTNWVGAAALAVFLLAYLAAAADIRVWRLWLGALLLGGFAYCLAAPWLPLSAIRVVLGNVFGGAAAQLHDLPRISAVAVLLLVFLLAARWLRRRGVAGHLRTFLLLLLLTGAATLAGAVGGGQASRFHPEMEMAFCLVVAFGCLPVWRRLSRGTRAILMVPLALLGVTQLLGYRGFAARQIVPIDIAGTIEGETAAWVEGHLGDTRVMLPGSIGFWLNVLADTPQLGGGAFQSDPHPFIDAVEHQIYSGQGAGDSAGEVATLWLEALGVGAVGWGGPGSRELYKPWRDPEKFAGVLRELRREGGDVIYEVAEGPYSRAHALRWDDFARYPDSVLDVEALRGYVAVLRSPEQPEVELRWLNPNRALIRGELDPQHLISVQVSYHPGWRAMVAGRPVEVLRDNLALVALAPGCSGPCAVELSFEGGLEAKILRFVSASAWSAGTLWLLIGWLGRGRARADAARWSSRPARSDDEPQRGA